MRVANGFKTRFEANVPLETDDSGAIFIDRSPKHFDKVLNFMRDGDVDLLRYSQQEIQEILDEARAYQIVDLIWLCEEKLHFRFIENDFQMAQILRSPEKPVIIFYYKMDTWDKVFGKPMAKDISVEKVLEQYKKLFDIYFKPNNAEHNFWSYSIHDQTFNGCSEPQRFNIKDFKKELKTKAECYIEEKKLAHMLY